MNIQDMITETRPPTPDRWAEFEALKGSEGALQGAVGSPMPAPLGPDSGPLPASGGQPPPRRHPPVRQRGPGHEMCFHAKLPSHHGLNRSRILFRF